MFKSQLHNVVTFESTAEFGQYCLKENIANRPKADKWTAFLSGEKAAHFAISGDDSQVSEAEKLMEKFQSEIETSAFIDMPSVAGCYPCVPEALAGEPECMREPTQVSSDSAPLSIVVDLACSQGIDKSIMQARGTAILALVMALSAKRPITLKLISAGDGRTNAEGDNFSIVAVDINTGPLDLATAAYAITNVGFVRQLCYGWQRRFMAFDGFWPTFEGIQKHAVESEPYKAKIKHYLGIDGEWLHIPGAISESQLVMTNPEKWLKEQLAKYQHQE